VELRFERLDEAARLPTRANPDDAGLDLYAAEPATVAPAGGRASIGTGLAVEIPPGHAGLVLPRSGLAARDGVTLANAPGLVDPGYRGELRVLLLNTDPEHAFEIEPGDRIAQLVLTPFVEGDAIEAPQLSASARGDGGFGSSGR
jgi:dUTP pyrophosphatase